MKRMLQLAFFVCLISLLSIPAVVEGQTDPATCVPFQQQAFSSFSNACGDTEFGEVCFGFNSVDAFTEQGNSLAPIEGFEQGDEIPIESVDLISTGGYNPGGGIWGLSLIELPAFEAADGDLEPNLRYLLFGDTEITNVDEPVAEGFEQLQSFTYQTTNTTPLCTDAPSHVLVQTDCSVDTAPRDFRVEGADMTLDGTAIFIGGAERGILQIFVLYGVLVIQPDRNLDGTVEQGEQTQPVIVPAGFATLASISNNEPLDSDAHVGPWSPIGPVLGATLEALSYIEAIPQNLTYCALETPLVRQSSGAGGTRTELRYLSSAALEALIPYCTVPNAPDFCDIYANAPWP